MRRIAVLKPFYAVILGLMLLAAPATSAQSVRDGSSGLSVIGRGTATAPADTAILQLAISEGPYGPPPAPQPEDVQRQAIEPIVQAVIDAGVSEDDIDVIVGPYVGGFGGYYGPATAALRISIESPTAQGISDLVQAATTAATDARLVIGAVGAIYGLDDCTALQREARELALDDARQQAEDMAELIGVTLGGIVASRDIPVVPQLTYGPYGPTPAIDPCGDLTEAVMAYGGAALPPVDPTADPLVVIDAHIEVSFSLPGDTIATPAS